MPDPSDPYSGYNAMQAHLGVPPVPVASPGDVARMLIDQSAQQRVASMSAGMPPSWLSGGGGGYGAASAFGDQFRQRFESIQAQQSYTPHMAQAMGGQYAPGMLPSPVMMTPPSTGVFRARPEGPRFAPLPPQPMQPPIQTPFTPRMPPPMFQLTADREARRGDQEQDAFFARAAQAPRVLGQGLGSLGAAALGGMVGGPIGALAGGVLGQASGFAQGVGDLMMKPFQPMIERRQMGASLRRMSQDWVVAGQDLHQTGRGMTRDASIRLAEEIQDLSKDRAFKRETGGMFNRSDLMKITQESGRAGLMDESQDIEGVRKNIKNVSRTLKKYMQLTQDPDMVNVLRELGQMKQLGMTLDDMEQAAQSMNRYSRAAGASIAGIKQMGMMGATTFQQAGLTGASGMTYGMHAAASARQAVATGTFQPRELALLGGVQGVAQRDMQAQAAMLTMPMFGAAVGQFGSRGFGVNQGALQQMGRGGAQGMVYGAVSSMRQAMQQGGVGALALYPLQQRRLQTEAAESMTPEQMQAMRFRMAMETGKFLNNGQGGAGAFAMGATAAFGTEIGEQMLIQAQDPQFFQAQRNRIQEQRQRLIREQRATNAAADLGGATQLGRAVWRGVGGEALGEGLGAAGRIIGGVAGGIGGAVRGGLNVLDDIQAESEGRMVTRLSDRFVSRSAAERRKVYGQDAGVLAQKGFQGPVDVSDKGYSARTVATALGYGGYGPVEEMSEVGGFLAKLSMPVQGAITQALGYGDAPAAGIEALIGGGAGLVMGPEATNKLVIQSMQKGSSFAKAAKFAATKANTREGFEAAYDALDKSSKGKASSGSAMRRAAGMVADKIKEQQNIILPDGTIDNDVLEQSLRSAMAEDGMSKEDIDKTISDLRSSGELSKVSGVVLNQAKEIAGPENAKIVDESIREAKEAEMKPVRDKQAQVMERKEKMVKSIEDQLDLTYDIGGKGIADKAGAQEFRELLVEGPAATLARSVVAMEGKEGSAKAHREAFKEYMKLYGKGRSEKEVKKEFDMQVEEMRKKPMSKDVKERFRESLTSGEAGTLSESVSKLSQASAMSTQLKQYGDIVGGGLETLIESAGGAGDKIRELAAKGDITGKGIAESFTKDDIRQLARSGQTALAGKIARYQKAGTPEEKQKIEQEIMETVGEMGEAKKKKEEELGEAEGKEAEDLAKSEEALAGIQGEMAAAFKDFRPAAEKFADGAEKLQKAMESDMFKRIMEGD